MTVAGIEKQQIARAQGEFLAAAGKAALAALDKAEDVMLVKVGGKGLYDALEAVGLEMQLVIIDRAAALVFYAHPSLAGLLYHCGGEMACTISSFLQRKNEVQTEQFCLMGKDKRQKLWYTAKQLETTNLKKTGAEEMTAEKLFEHQGAILLAQSDGCAVWQFRNETGDGTMTTYEIFSGVMLAFNDFHMERYECDFVADRRMLAIDHCREGRMEYPAGDNLVAYTAAGDMKLDLREQHTGTFHFPSCHYHGLTVAFDRNIVRESLPREVKDFPATPEKIVERWQLGSTPRVVHGAERMEHIFGEMYRVPEKIRIPYFKVKILELLLYLDAMTIPQVESERPYFYKTQVEKVEAIKRFLTEHVAENFTQEELSSRFDIAMTPMKTCFRSAYGAAIGTWLTNYRMNLAAELLLKEKGLSVSEIGGRVGYDSAGKFTGAFKKVMHLTPSEYRRERGRRYEG